MAIAKVVLGGVTLMDTTGVTVTAETLANGITALGADGELITGTYSSFNEDDDFCFWDYDGTPVYSCSREQLMAMTELPQPPDHSQDDIPLTFLYWNWTLADLKAFNGVMDIGACYKPTDGKAHWFYRLTEASGLTCSFTLNYTNDVVINWGDGTGDEHWGSQTDNGSSVTHTYTQPGTYHCTMLGTGRPSTAMRTEDNKCLVGQFIVGDNMTEFWLGSWWSAAVANSSIETIITNDIMSGKTRMCAPKMEGCRLLKAYVYNPYYLGDQSTLRNAYSCKIVCFSNSAINSGLNVDYLCSGARQLKRVRLGPNMIWSRFSFNGTAIEFFNGYRLGYDDLDSCYCLRRLVIKSTIDNAALANCPEIEEIWCGLTTPPTLGSSTPFSKLKSYAIIHVPAEAVEDYKAATNWSLHADKIVGDWVADPIK